MYKTRPYLYTVFTRESLKFESIPSKTGQHVTPARRPSLAHTLTARAWSCSVALLIPLASLLRYAAAAAAAAHYKTLGWLILTVRTIYSYDHKCSTGRITLFLPPRACHSPTHSLHKQLKNPLVLEPLMKESALQGCPRKLIVLSLPNTATARRGRGA